jgi:hypothetical protein
VVFGLEAASPVEIGFLSDWELRASGWDDEFLKLLDNCSFPVGMTTFE